MMSVLVKETLGDDDDDDDHQNNVDDDSNIMNLPDIPLPNVSADVLSKVIEYCKYYQDDEMRTIQTPLNSNKLEETVFFYKAENHDNFKMFSDKSFDKFT